VSSPVWAHHQILAIVSYGFVDEGALSDEKAMIKLRIGKGLYMLGEKECCNSQLRERERGG
jgi:hypothetical protein